MRAVRRLRTVRFRSIVMPLLLAALVFRVLVPPGFMMVGAGASSLQAAMCSGTNSGKIEKIELPGGGQAHCEYCSAPPSGAPLAQLVIESPVRAAAPAFSVDVAQVDGFTLIRAQSARAPPSV
jgi:DUF2946 family protein